MREIAKHYLAQVTLTLAKTGKTMKVEDAALELVVQKGYNMAFGARVLKRYIDEHIKLPISARWKEGTHFEVRAQNGDIVVEPSIGKVTSPDAATDCPLWSSAAAPLSLKPVVPSRLERLMLAAKPEALPNTT